jgi:AcrR family transcriptional regulator
MQITIQLPVNDSLYLRNPEETELGKKLVSEGIILIDEIGFQEFTFKKLAKKIESTEASVYRYFKSKQHLLQYIVAWYWLWLKYVITIKTANIKDSNECLKIAIKVLIDSDKYDPDISHIDEHALFKIIIAESARVSLTRQEDDIKGKDLFDGYEQLISLLASFVKGIKSDYKYPVMLSHSLISAVHKQVFFCEHFPKSIIFKGKKGERKEILNFINNFVFSALK